MTDYTDRWQRSVPVYDAPVVTRAYVLLLTLAALAIGLTTYRELAGLGPVTGLNDAYAWGIWKTFNVMVLTGLGSGGFAVGIAAWMFNRKRLHTVMRTALLTSFLAYLSGLFLLGIDVGRPWNMFWLLAPWKWNGHSPLLEVAFCMPVYAMIPLALENVPPVLEWMFDHKPHMRPTVEKLTATMTRFYPYVVTLAYVLPAMHQSSLGALMLLAGDRVNPLWQTPWLPLLYVWAASYMGFACVAGTLLFCSIVWNRFIDLDVLHDMAQITGRLIAGFVVFRFVDIAFRGQLGAAFSINRFAGLFWFETLVLIAGGLTLYISAKRKDARMMFVGHLIAAIGGSLYRFNPTTLAFQPHPGAFYFPAAVEILISLGFVALAMAGFMLAAKLLAILPAPLSTWFEMEAALGIVRHETADTHKVLVAGASAEN